MVLDQDGGVTDEAGNPFVSSKKIDVIESDNRVEVVFLKGKGRGVTLTWNRKANAEILLPKRLMRKIDGRYYKTYGVQFVHTKWNSPIDTFKMLIHMILVFIYFLQQRALLNGLSKV